MNLYACDACNYLFASEDNPGTCPAYDLSDDKYHVALMLLFYFKSAPGYQVPKFLNDILPAKNSFAETHVARAMAREL